MLLELGVITYRIWDLVSELYSIQVLSIEVYGFCLFVLICNSGYLAMFTLSLPLVKP